MSRYDPPRPGGETDHEPAVPEWWLDTSALPARLLWARLVAGIDGFQVFDLDGRMHLFERLDDAIAWLRADEYEALDILKADGDVARDIVPPSDDSWR